MKILVWTKSRFFLATALLALNLASLSSSFAQIGESVPDSQAIQYWNSHRDTVLTEVGELHQIIVRKTEEIRESLTPQQLFRALLENKIQVKGRFGKAEATLVDKTVVYRITHNQTQIAFIVFEAGSVNLDSEHLQKLVSRLQVSAGKDRTDGVRGRHVVVLQIEDHDFIDSSNHPRPTRFQDRVNAFWNSIKKKPTFGDFAVGTACAVLQAGVACGISLAKAEGVWESVDLTASYLSLGFGIGIGTFISTYREWANQTFNKLEAGFRTGLNSAAFAYSLTFLSKGHASELSVFDIGMHAHVLSNVVMSNIVRTQWAWISRIREESGVNRRMMEIKIPWVSPKKAPPAIIHCNGFPVTLDCQNNSEMLKINQASLEYQALYMAQYSVRLADLTNVEMMVPGFSNPIQLGKVLLYSSYFFVQRIALWQAGLLNWERTPEIQAQWNTTMSWLLPWKSVPLISKKVWNGLEWIGTGQALEDLKQKIEEYKQVSPVDRAAKAQLIRTNISSVLIGAFVGPLKLFVFAQESVISIYKKLTSSCENLLTESKD